MNSMSAVVDFTSSTSAVDVLVLSYLKSCEHGTITGGTATVGLERSDVRDSQIVRAKVPCDGGKVQLTSAQANASAASAFRLQSADGEPTLFALAPVVQLPKDLTPEGRTLSIRRTDRPGERHEVKIDDAIAAAGFYDLAKSEVSLAPGGTYDASIGGQRRMLLILICSLETTPTLPTPSPASSTPSRNAGEAQRAHLIAQPVE